MGQAGLGMLKGGGGRWMGFGFLGDGPFLD